MEEDKGRFVFVAQELETGKLINIIQPKIGKVPTLKLMFLLEKEYECKVLNWFIALSE
jgi:hypothetical protein